MLQSEEILFENCYWRGMRRFPTGPSMRCFYILSFALCETMACVICNSAVSHTAVRQMNSFPARSKLSFVRLRGGSSESVLSAEQQGLWQAVECHNKSEATKWLKAGADPDLCCSADVHQLEFSPFHAASARGDLEMMRLLLSNGASVNATNVHEYTALHFAALQGNIEACSLLLQVHHYFSCVRRDSR